MSIFCTYICENTGNYVICVVHAFVSQLNVDSEAREISVRLEQEASVNGTRYGDKLG